jgi:hypothetical protein
LTLGTINKYLENQTSFMKNILYNPYALVMRRCFHKTGQKYWFYGGGAKGFAHIGV